VRDLIELERLAALDRLEVLDTPAEPLFDSLTELAAQTFSVPIALISLVDRERQWFKACVGLDVDHTERNISFCQHAIVSDDVMVVHDAAADERFCKNPLVVGAPGIRFYAGAPLITPEGQRLGTLSIIDTMPRVFSSRDALRLAAIAKSVMQALVWRLESRERERIAVIAADQAELLTQAEEMAGVGTWSWDAVGDRTTWSNQVYHIHGYAAGTEAPPLAGVLERYHPNDAKMLSGLIQRALDEGQRYALTARIYRPDGEERHVVARGAGRQDGSGAIIGLTGTFQDVTEHVASGKFVRTLTDNLPGPVGYWDTALRCKFANAAYEDWFGRSPEEMLTLTLPALLGPELFSRNEKNIRGALAGERQSFSQTLVKPGGQATCALTNYIPDIDASGQTQGFYVLVSDVTAIAEAQSRAESAARAKADFLSNMSHEIRTPLNGVIGFSDILRTTALSAEQASYVHRITSASRSLLQIINDVLDFSKIDAGRMDLELRPFDLRSLIEDVVSLISVAQPNPRVKISFGVSPDIAAKVAGDETRLRQILINLLGNAAKFTEAGHVRLDARLRSNELCLIVADTGPGIPAEKLEHVFTGFSQADSSINRRFGGTGLGLSISKSLARLMQGDLTLVSTPGEGTNAILTLPYLAERRKRDVEAGIPNDNGKAPVGARVMVVDDVEMNRALVEIGLSASGHTVTSFASAQEAIDALEDRAAFDVILMDIQMPGMDGITAARRIRRMTGAARSIPIVAMTANALDSHVTEYKSAGMDAHFPKPVNMKALNGLVARLTQHKMEVDPHPAAELAPAPLSCPIVELRAEYRNYLSTVSGEFDKILKLTCDEKVISSVGDLVHAIAGTAGSLGFDAVSDEAFALQATVKKIRKSSDISQTLVPGLNKFLNTVAVSCA